jgi:hypothetical protein
MPPLSPITPHGTLAYIDNVPQLPHALDHKGIQALDIDARLLVLLELQSHVGVLGQQITDL